MRIDEVYPLKENAPVATKKNAAINSLFGGSIAVLGKTASFLAAGSLQAALIASGFITPVGLAANVAFYGTLAAGSFLSVYLAMQANKAMTTAFGDDEITTVLKTLDKITEKRDKVLKDIEKSSDDKERLKRKREELKQLTKEMVQYSKILRFELQRPRIESELTTEQKKYIRGVSEAGIKGKLTLIKLRGML